MVIICMLVCVVWCVLASMYRVLFVMYYLVDDVCELMFSVERGCGVLFIICCVYCSLCRVCNYVRVVCYLLCSMDVVVCVL